LHRNTRPYASSGTLAEAAELVIEPAPVKVECTRCGLASEVQPNRLLCAGCGDYRTRLVSGDEMLRASLELSRLETREMIQPCA
jgi:hydrogenase nickel incorporation protein HypA/HybF